MLSYDADSMEPEQLDGEGAGLIPAAAAPSPFTLRSIARPLLVVLGIGLMVLGILSARGVGPFADNEGSTPASVPVSSEFEDAFGIRLKSVDITAAGGMIQLRYQVLDKDKAQALHTAEGEDPAVVVISSAGHEYSDPGIAGHSHVAGVFTEGNIDSILLANAGGGVHPGDVVTVRIGDVELHGVPVD
jgi:hypothetical protein